MTHKSDFSPDITEYALQQIEEIKSRFPDALFMLEEISENRVLLKIKNHDDMFEVDSTSDCLIDAIFVAKEKAMSMLVSKYFVTSESKKMVVPLEKYVN